MPQINKSIEKYHRGVSQKSLYFEKTTHIFAFIYVISGAACIEFKLVLIAIHNLANILKETNAYEHISLPGAY